jgi:hypothetical protein
MKQLLFLLLLLPLQLFAEDSTMIYRTRYANILNSATHKSMVWFTNQEGTVFVDFQNYLEFIKKYYQDEKLTDTYKGKYVYRKSFVGNASDKPLPIQINVAYNTDKTISKVTITGPWGQMADLFVSYWEKPFHLSEKRHVKGEVAWLNSFGDRVSFYNVGANDAKIVITPNEVTKKNYYHYVIR